MTKYRYYTRTSIKATTGLVAAYSFSPETVSNGTLIDISGNGNNGTISGALLTKDGMKFDGVNDKITLGAIGNIKSVAFRIKLATTTEQILEGAVNAKLIISNAGILTYTDFDNCFVNGSDSDLISAGIWHDVVITSTTDVNMSATTLALNNASYGSFEISDLRFYSSELTVTQAKAYHNSFVKPYLLEDFSNHPIGDTSPKGWVKGTGSYKISEETTGTSLVPLGTKYLQNTTQGTIAIPSKQAYGEWEFDVYKEGDGNEMYITFLSQTFLSGNSNKGYSLRIGSLEYLALRRVPTIDNGFITTSSYIANNTWYKIKVARLQSAGTFASIVPSMTTVYLANTFAVFIKGGSFGNNWTLVSTVGGSGTNPVTDGTYTTSEYFVADLDAGDKIANIKLLNGVKQ